MKKSNRNSTSLKSGFAFRISDDSMNEVGIKAGDAVYVRRHDRIKNEMLVCVQVSGQLMIRRYLDKGDTGTLEACSPKYENIEINWTCDNLDGVEQFLGEVIGIIEGL